MGVESLHKNKFLHSIVLTGKKGEYYFTPGNRSDILRSGGKFSVIYKGKTSSGDRDVVIKMLHPRINKSAVERRRFVREYVNSIKDAVFPEVIDICEKGNDLYIIREYIEGVDLSKYKSDRAIKELVNREGKERVIVKIMDAFIRVHEHKVIHGDIKPSNILLYNENNELKIKIVDLGLAVPFAHSLSRDTQNPLPFSLIYSSPELMLNYPEVINQTTDVFSLSLTIYEFLTENKPVDISHPALMMSLQLNEPLESHRKITTSTLEVLNKAAFKYKFPKPVQNYSADQVRKALRSAVLCRYQTIEEFKADLVKSFAHKDSFIKRWFK